MVLFVRSFFLPFEFYDIDSRYISIIKLLNVESHKDSSKELNEIFGSLSVSSLIWCE